MRYRTATITVDFPKPVQEALARFDWPSDNVLVDTLLAAANLCAINHPEEYAECIIRVLQGEFDEGEFDEGEFDEEEKEGEDE
jgi:hypothetical protein